MDVSPRALRAVTFRERLRGYHPEDVDQFLERVAEGVAALQNKLDDAIARADRAERDNSELSEGEEAVRRTLTLAQRTADLALKEAKDEAARLVSDARATAERLAEEAQRQLRSDLERLEAARKQLQADVVAMQQYVENERTRVRNALADLVRKVEATSRKPPAPPAATPIDVPPVRRVVVEAPPTPAFTPAPLPMPEPAPEPELDEGVPEPSPFVVTAPEPAAEFEPEPEPEAEPTQEPVVAAAEEAEAPEPPPRMRREPQPPPVLGTRFAQARPSGGPPAGPPPGPRRLALSMERPADEAPDAPPADPDDAGVAKVRRLFGRSS